VYLIEEEEVVPLEGVGLVNIQGSWSKDGRSIVFVTTRRGPFQIWLMNADGSEQSLFSRSGDAKNTSPDLSPDGRLVVFTQRELPSGIPYIVEAPISEDGLSEFKLTGLGSPARAPKYSPDGEWLAIESWPDGDNHDIYLLNRESREIIQLTFDPAFDFDPAWRPVIP
jgi:Tol biopolymer transport system component